MLRYLIILAIVSTVFENTKAQVTSTQRINAENIQQVRLELEQVAFISIKNSDKKEIEMQTKSTGEYSQAIRLDKKITKNKLVIRSVFDKKLKSGFDKLSALKVFSIKLHLFIPADIKVDIRTDITNINLNGSYKSVHIENKFGNCRFNHFHGNAQVNTYNGNIYIETNNANIKASTQNGTKEVALIKGKKHQINVKTINGNIKIKPLLK